MRKLNDNTIGSVIPVLLYLIGLILFGFMYWLMNGILDIAKDTGLADTTTYTVYPLLLLLWTAVVIVYVIFGGMWLIRSYNEWNQYGGM